MPPPPPYYLSFTRESRHHHHLSSSAANPKPQLMAWGPPKPFIQGNKVRLTQCQKADNINFVQTVHDGHNRIKRSQSTFIWHQPLCLGHLVWLLSKTAWELIKRLLKKTSGKKSNGNVTTSGSKSKSAGNSNFAGSEAEKLMKESPKESSQSTKDDESIFKVFNLLAKEVRRRNGPQTQSRQDALQWVRKLMKHSVPGGKMNRGLTVIHTTRACVQGRSLTPKELYDASVLGWCVEWLQAFSL